MQHPMSEVAVLVIDMFNTYRHQDAELLAPNAADIINFDELVAAALDGERPDLIRPIAPQKDCLRILKVRHSTPSLCPLGSA